MNEITDFEMKKRASEIFENVVDMTEEERLGFLKKACKDNWVLMREVQTLLNNCIDDTRFMSRVLGGRGHTHETIASNPGDKIGNYELLERLGAGGMAEVFLAKRIDGVSSTPVALKLIHGWGNPTELLGRFSRERQILASLVHPNIASFMDGGVTENGRPYFVMEYVNGINLREYCNGNKEIELKEKLQIFIKICSAVSNAHERLIVHRDLKPGNILIKANGEPKLLDFGIAKVLISNEEDEHITDLCNPLTPGYCSPEQVLHEQLTTASDQFTLGIILYEMLTGVIPFDGEVKTLAGYDWDIKLKKPSSQIADKKLKKQISGDLDSIILNVLRREPGQRYQSVQKLSEDIERFLRMKPISVRSHNFFYTASRYFKRNLKILSVSIIAIILLSIGIITQQLRVWNERNIAVMERDASEFVKGFMIDLFKISDPGEARGNEITAREILDRGAIQISSELDTNPEIRSELLNVMGNVYMKLGLYEQATDLLDQALDLRQEYSSENSFEIAEIQYSIAILARLKGNYKVAEDLALKALLIREEKFGEKSKQVADSLHSLGTIYTSLGAYSKAIEYFESSVEIRIALYGEMDRVLVESYSNLGAVYEMVGKYGAAMQVLEKAITIGERIYEAEHIDMAYVYTNLGVVYDSLKNTEKALEHYKKSLDIKLKVLGETNIYVANVYNNIGVIYSDQKDCDEALNYFQKDLEITEKVLGYDHPNTAISYGNIADALHCVGEFDKAILNVDQAITIISQRVGGEHISLAPIYETKGVIASSIGNQKEAEKYLGKALRIFSDNLGNESKKTLAIKKQLDVLNSSIDLTD